MNKVCSVFYTALDSLPSQRYPSNPLGASTDNNLSLLDTHTHSVFLLDSDVCARKCLLLGLGRLCKVLEEKDFDFRVNLQLISIFDH